MSLRSESHERRLCDCGCGRSFPLFAGVMSYGHGEEVFFRAAHLRHDDRQPHLWLLLGGGAWSDDDGRNCWITLRRWANDDQIVTRIEDPQGAPFGKDDAMGERRLGRDEVLAMEGALDWAIARVQQFTDEHRPTRDFLIGPDGDADAPARRCETCGEMHPVDELELAFRRPDVIVALDEAERRQHSREGDDVCILRGERFFVRAVLPLPVSGRETGYAIGLWVEVQPTAFEQIDGLWSDPRQADEPPLDACIANDVPLLPPMVGLPVHLQLTGPTTRPEVRLPPGGHPLYREQSEGISEHRAHEYSALFARRIR